jgi:hypothetical protein
MQGGYDWHLQAPEKSQNVTTRRTAENSILVLQAYQIEISKIQEISGLLVR